ncbi:MAG: capsular exopolysaccharide family [Acidimicrobiales bacterium]|nr:capsular exopolysaccharide family [Acidimicrobiales bacterium]
MSTEPRPQDDLELRDHLDVLRRHRLLIVATIALAVLVATAATVLRIPQYRAGAEVLLQQEADRDVLAEGRSQQNPAYLGQLVQTEMQVMRSRSVRDAVAAELGRTPDVSISAKDETQVVVISAVRDSKREAAREANTYASVYADISQRQTRTALTEASNAIRDQLATLDRRVEGLHADLAELQARTAAATDDDELAALAVQEGRLRATIEAQEGSLATRRVALTEQIDQLELAANLSQSRGVRVVSEAALPGAPISPRPVRDIPLAAVLGLVLGVALAFVRDHLDDTIRTKEDLDRSTGALSVLGLVPDIDGWRDRGQARLESLANPTSPAAEAYRGVRTSLQFIGLERKLRVIQITSSTVAEGKSTTSANLAVALARAGKRVVLVDCDLRRPRVHRFFDLDNAVGFTSVILREVPAAAAYVPVPDVPRLSVMPSGPIPPNPSELLSTSAAVAALHALDEEFDFVIVDSPPLLPVADSVVLAGYVDATVLVATSRSTTKRSLTRALELLRQIDAPLVGVVFNKVGGHSADGYGYGHRDAYAQSTKTRRATLRRSAERPTQDAGRH